MIFLSDRLRMVTYIKTSRRRETETGDIIKLGVSYLKEFYNKDMISQNNLMKFLFNASFKHQTC